MTKTSIARRLFPLVLASAGLVACGQPAGPAASSTPTTSAVAVQDWKKADACKLLTADDIAGYLGGQRPEGKREDKFDRPTCVWTDPATKYLKVNLTLWQPPDASVVTGKPKRTVPVAGKSGYVNSETPTNCRLEVDAGPAFASLDISATKIENACERAVQSLTGVIKTLGW